MSRRQLSFLTGFRARALRPLAFAAAALAAAQAQPQAAQAWGHTKDLNTQFFDSQLVGKVLQRGEIDYCVQIEDARFGLGTIQRQVQAVLRLWLKPLEDLGIRDVRLQSMNCWDPDFNLKVLIAPEETLKTVGSYQQAWHDGDHYYSLVKIDSAYVFHNHDKDYTIVDFEDFVPGGVPLLSVLNDVSIAHPRTPEAFAAERQVDYDAVFWSSYRILLHETGHSFGLCDTYSPALEVHCDPAHTTAEQPSSVMKDSNYFYLTGDDIAGIKALFNRFK